MIDLNEFVSKYVTFRNKSMFLSDIETNRSILQQKIEGKSLLVIGGAGSIGASYIRAMLPFRPSKLLVIDLNENGLTELTRSLRSTYGLFLPQEYRTYALNFSDPIFERIFREEKGFDIVANFSAHKHVRSEKDKYAVQALLENNVLKAQKLLELLVEFPPKHFFCVSTDKATNPVNVMGASKSIMEELIMAYRDKFKVTAARFANVAFSNGSLLDSFVQRLMKRQPLVAPYDVKRYFVSLEESGQICMLACMLGQSGEIFFPKLNEDQMITFTSICDRFLEECGFETKICVNEEEAKSYAQKMSRNHRRYPVVYFKSDTTGEKTYEEFYEPNEQVNLTKFLALGIIETKNKHSRQELFDLLNLLMTIFQQSNFTKSELIGQLKQFLPHFTHEEKRKNLDQKM